MLLALLLMYHDAGVRRAVSHRGPCLNLLPSEETTPVPGSMPRFLNTWTGEFEWYNSPRDVHYAILSHTWRLLSDGGEQSFDDIRRLQAAVKDVDDPPRPPPYSGYSERGTIFAHPELSAKIKGICKIAREAGFRLIWIDSCCIDKTSSAELSEAINSMFEWYRLSDVCYAYLEDVPESEDPSDPDSYFRDSRWHTRCWTLQELIAPKSVQFLTESWHLLGTKLGLAITLETITGISFNILTGQAGVDSASVARRMSWAATREAARIEDRAYSLMGLFNVHMPTIYGEGTHAFLRLQEEIVKTIPDQSVFAWGIERRPECPPYPGLFASGPEDFTGCGDITPVTPSHFASMLDWRGSEDVPPLDCVLTPLGVRIQLLCVNIAANAKVQDIFRKEENLKRCWNCTRYAPWFTQIVGFAFLRCQDGRGSLVALPLWEPREEAGHGMFIGTHLLCNGAYNMVQRTVPMTKEDLLEVLQHISLLRFDASLLRHSSGDTTHNNIPSQELRPKFWFRAREETAVNFCIASLCLDTMRSVGVIPDLPLEVVRSRPRLLITVHITLRAQHMPDPAAQVGTSIAWETFEAELSVSNSVDSLPDTGPPSLLPPLSLGPPVPVASSPSTINATPELVGDGKRPCHRRPHVAGSPVTLESITSEHEFRVYSGVHSERDICTVRVLRIAFRQGRLPDSLSLDPDSVLVFIDISEPYQHDRGVARAPERGLAPEGMGSSSERGTTRHTPASGQSGGGEADRPSSSSFGHAHIASVPSEAIENPEVIRPSEQKNADALRYEIDELREQTSLMNSQIAALTSKNTEMASQMAALLDRLNLAVESQGLQDADVARAFSPSKNGRASPRTPQDV
ncbi:hypothetical protein VTO73DRAFT_12418 [Trametes versicolor]